MCIVHYPHMHTSVILFLGRLEYKVFYVEILHTSRIYH
jgi:hypothetical protein